MYQALSRPSLDTRYSASSRAGVQPGPGCERANGDVLYLKDMSPAALRVIAVRPRVHVDALSIVEGGFEYIVFYTSVSFPRPPVPEKRARAPFALERVDTPRERERERESWGTNCKMSLACFRRRALTRSRACASVRCRASTRASRRPRTWCSWTPRCDPPRRRATPTASGSGNSARPAAGVGGCVRHALSQSLKTRARRRRRRRLSRHERY